MPTTGFFLAGEKSEPKSLPVSESPEVAATSFTWQLFAASVTI